MTTITSGLSDESGFVKALSEEIGDLYDLYVFHHFDNMGKVHHPDFKSKNPLPNVKLRDQAGVASEVGIGDVYLKTRRCGYERIR